MVLGGDLREIWADFPVLFRCHFHTVYFSDAVSVAVGMIFDSVAVDFGPFLVPLVAVVVVEFGRSMFEHAPKQVAMHSDYG